MRRWIWLLAILALGFGLAAWSAHPPPAPERGAPAAASLERAMQHVNIIAARPHPSGSAEIERVRGYLLTQLRSLGLEVEVHRLQGVEAPAAGFIQAGAMQNLLATLPGRDRTLPALLVMTHYDTVANSPGAADDTAGVATALEIARALKASGPHARDTLFLFTDGEEAGLLGAQAFFARDPLARRVGVVLNMEARGDSGRALMFETGAGSGGLVRLFGRTARQPSANSLMAYVYQLMPNRTDFTHARAHDLPGLNFAFLADQLAYHTPLATPAHLDRASLAHLGGEVLPVAQALADASQLPAAGPQLTYADLFGRLLIAYPAWAGWILWAVSLLLVVFAAVQARRSGRMAAGELARGALGWLLLGCTVALGLYTAALLLPGGGVQGLYARLAAYRWLFTGAAALALGLAILALGQLVHGGRRIWAVLAAAVAGVVCNLGGFDPVAIGLAVATAMLGLAALGRPTSAWGLWLGALVGALVLTLLAQALAPPTAFFAGWPLLAGAAAAALATLWREDLKVWPSRLLAAVIAVAAVGEVGAFAASLFDALGPPSPFVLAAPALLLALVLTPWLAGDGMHLRPVGLCLAAAGAALIALVGRGFGADPAHPTLTQALYVAGPAPGQSRRVANLARLDSWSRAALSADGGRPTRENLQPLFGPAVWTAGASRAAGLTAPAIVVQRSPLGAESRLTIRAAPRSGGEMLMLWIRPSETLRATALNGDAMAVEIPGNRWSELRYSAPAAGESLELLGPARTRLELEAAEFRTGWPAGVRPPPPKPPGLMGWGWSDYTVTITREGAAR